DPRSPPRARLAPAPPDGSRRCRAARGDARCRARRHGSTPCRAPGRAAARRWERSRDPRSAGRGATTSGDRAARGARRAAGAAAAELQIEPAEAVAVEPCGVRVAGQLPARISRLTRDLELDLRVSLELEVERQPEPAEIQAVAARGPVVAPSGQRPAPAHRQ